MAVSGLGAMSAGCLRRRPRKAHGGQLKRARLACASPRQPPIQFAANNTKDAGESPPRDGRCLQEGGRRVYAETFWKAVLVRRRLHRDIMRRDDATITNGGDAMNRLAFTCSCLLLASCDNVDTKTRVLAENVLYETKATSTLQSGNVQDALDEITPTLSDFIIGTWSVANYGQTSNHAGTVTFGADASYSVDGDFNAASIPFAWVDPPSTPAGYQVVSNNLVILSFNPGGAGPVQNWVCPGYRTQADHHHLGSVAERVSAHKAVAARR